MKSPAAQDTRPCLRTHVRFAAAVVYLASPASGYTTGTILDVDGGNMMGRSIFDIVAKAEEFYRK